uniref:FoP_duplication domain-containing protein n=1 Tax=Panagrellus redivivus TaxID=6233 RepID=A0A7E4UTN1_PANRE
MATEIVVRSAMRQSRQKNIDFHHVHQNSQANQNRRVVFKPRQTVVKNHRRPNKQQIHHRSDTVIVRRKVVRPRATLKVVKLIQKKKPANRHPIDRIQKPRRTMAKPTADDLDKDLESYMKKEPATEMKPTPVKPVQKKSVQKQKQPKRITKKNRKLEVKPTADDLDRELELYMKKSTTA